MAQPTLAKTKDKDEKRWMIESAASTLREMARISKDPELLAAAEKELDRQQAETELARDYVNAVNEKSPSMVGPLHLDHSSGSNRKG